MDKKNKSLVDRGDGDFILNESGTSVKTDKVEGDLNGDQQSEWYTTIQNSELLEDAFRQARTPYTGNGTFNGFGKNLSSMANIDHIFVSSHFMVSRWGILSDSYQGKFPSDHFPVLAEVELK